jgi:hypothetical protein
MSVHNEFSKTQRTDLNHLESVTRLEDGSASKEFSFSELLGRPLEFTPQANNNSVRNYRKTTGSVVCDDYRFSKDIYQAVRCDSEEFGFENDQNQSPFPASEPRVTYESHIINIGAINLMEKNKLLESEIRQLSARQDPVCSFGRSNIIDGHQVEELSLQIEELTKRNYELINFIQNFQKELSLVQTENPKSELNFGQNSQYKLREQNSLPYRNSNEHLLERDHQKITFPSDLRQYEYKYTSNGVRCLQSMDPIEKILEAKTANDNNKSIQSICNINDNDGGDHRYLLFENNLLSILENDNLIFKKKIDDLESEVKEIRQNRDAGVINYSVIDNLIDMIRAKDSQINFYKEKVSNMRGRSNKKPTTVHNEGFTEESGDIFEISPVKNSYNFPKSIGDDRMTVSTNHHCNISESSDNCLKRIYKFDDFYESETSRNLNLLSHKKMIASGLEENVIKQIRFSLKTM